jgi:glutathione S-transferase
LAFAFLTVYFTGKFGAGSEHVLFQLTIADIALYFWMEGMEEGVISGVLPKFPTLEAFVKRIDSLPKMQEWINKRPDVPFSLISKKKK